MLTAALQSMKQQGFGAGPSGRAWSPPPQRPQPARARKPGATAATEARREAGLPLMVVIWQDHRKEFSKLLGGELLFYPVEMMQATPKGVIASEWAGRPAPPAALQPTLALPH